MFDPSQFGLATVFAMGFVLGAVLNAFFGLGYAISALSATARQACFHAGNFGVGFILGYVANVILGLCGLGYNKPGFVEVSTQTSGEVDNDGEGAAKAVLFCTKHRNLEVIEEEEEDA